MTALPKTCTKCLQEKDESAFGRYSGSRQGLHAACRDCRNAQARAWRAANTERLKGYKSPRRQSHPGRQAQYSREYRERHPEKAREHSDRWRAENPDAVNETRRRRRAALSGAVVEHLDLAALREQSTGCGICSSGIDWTLRWPDPGSPSLDHIIPLAKGGAHEQGNVQWTHLVCNQRKGTQVRTA